MNKFLNGLRSRLDGLISKTVGIAESDLNTPPAVSSDERMSIYPYPGEYVAFSLSAAMKRLRGMVASQNYRIVGLRQKTNREKPQLQSPLGIYFEKPKIAETQIDQGKS